ncbi:hypothetical protein DWB68_15205 [Galactobacter valiniphilus]|uniref:Uncharacterized protein n=1 Tax=Galactobacter valiniphilus TaxID=2676122 RepID=A0A399J6J4_9MICC|nr:hypothetical protein [Galactobacter valiniphilus]RII40944.1 hypothetical protein DWB68_15205 [Galactobacter valiniphilus]
MTFTITMAAFRELANTPSAPSGRSSARGKFGIDRPAALKATASSTPASHALGLTVFALGSDLYVPDLMWSWVVYVIGWSCRRANADS